MSGKSAYFMCLLLVVAAKQPLVERLHRRKRLRHSHGTRRRLRCSRARGPTRRTEHDAGVGNRTNLPALI